MIPRTKSQEEMIDEIVSKKIEAPLKNISTDLGNKLDEISNRMSSKPKEEKIEEIIQKMKNRIPEKVGKKEESVKEPIKEHIEEPIKEYVKAPEHVHDDVFCPTCQKGHIHKMESNGLRMKCTDGTCGEELFVIPKSADHSCTNCGFPIKKPADENKLEACPFCNNKKAIPFSNGKPEIKFDFSKMKK